MAPRRPFQVGKYARAVSLRTARSRLGSQKVSPSPPYAATAWVIIIHHIDCISIRSSSVIFLPHESTHGGAPSGDTTTKDITKPYLCGFGHSRPGQVPENEPAPVQGHKQQQSPWNSSIPKQAPSRSKTYWNITLDQYHHPAKRVDSSLSYTQAFDLYS